jgi:hypothetical protein
MSDPDERRAAIFAEFAARKNAERAQDVAYARRDLESFMETYPAESKALLDRKAKLEKVTVSLHSVAGLGLTKVAVKAELDLVTALLGELEADKKGYELDVVRNELKELDMDVTEVDAAVRMNALECCRFSRVRQAANHPDVLPCYARG